MIVVCRCGQKSRIKTLTTVDRVRCASCKAQLAPEVHRQAKRNAAIVLEIAAVLFAKPEAKWTREEETIARILATHEKEKP